MKKRYNIALIPFTRRQAFIELSHCFSTIADSYLLGEKSLPHVTLCQFETDESELDTIWKSVFALMPNASLQLTFSEFSCVTKLSLNWISLLPDKIDILKKMHSEIASIIKTPLNKSFKEYDPHMTLINSKDPSYQKAIEKISYAPLTDKFTIALGRSDEMGQLTEVLYRLSIET